MSNIERLRALSVKLEETESALSAFWHLAPFIFLVSSRDGYIVKANDAWRRILGHHSTDLIGLMGRDFLHPDDVESAIAARKSAFIDGFVKDFRCRYRHKDGHYVTLNWNSTLIHSNKFIYAIANQVCDAG